jgi:hypothetical protein
MQPQREAKLVHANAEKSQVKKRPGIPTRKSAPYRSFGFGKRRQP